MGQESGRMRVASLNYSGIFVSPFEFYAMDNWQELEKIGAIYEENLRQHFGSIKNEIRAMDPKKAPEDDYYTRKRFEWKIDKLDKEIKEERLSPLYIKEFSVEELPTFQYAGIKKDNSLLDELDFKEEWTRFKKGFPDSKFSDLEMMLCRRFDFECYRAIIMYLYSRPEHAHFFRIDRKGEEVLKFDEIVEGIRQLGSQQRVQAIGVYRAFMAGYFKRIDSPTKIQMTVDYIFKKWDLDVINLQEANVKLRERLFEQDKYFVFAPAEELQSDQCILLIKKQLTVIPDYFRTHYQAEQNSIARVRDKVEHTLKSFQTFEKNRKELDEAIENHFNAVTSQRIFKKMAGEVKADTFKRYRQIVRQQIFSELMNPLKGQIDNWLSTYAGLFFDYWGKKAAEETKPKDKQVIQEYLKQLMQKGLLFWTEAFILTCFRFTNKELQRHEANSATPFILGSFHLSSKEPKNKLQVQILGILIYELAVRNYKVVFAGDYNSHIVVGEKEHTEGLFAFVKRFHAKDAAAAQKVKQLQNTLNIFPKHPMILTTKKKRTILQVQAKKTNLLAEKCIDQIISNVPILQDECYTGEVGGLGSGKNQNKNFIPHMEHPYDHFIVEAVLNLSAPERGRE